MRDISFQDCVEFQDSFLFDGKFSPFESVGDFRTYYPRVLIGEIGGLINLSCKLRRSANIYSNEILDECADIFTYLLLFGRMLEIHDQKQVFGLIANHWSEPPAGPLTEEEYYNRCQGMMEMVFCFLKPGKEAYYNENHFYHIFSSIQQASNFITKLPWQYVVNQFHLDVIQKHTDPIHFTPDGLYKGSFRINIDKILRFIAAVELELPEKRVSFLKRIMVAQDAFWSQHSREAGVKSSIV